MTLLLSQLDATPAPTIEEALTRARRVVGARAGIVRRVTLEPSPVDGPRAYFASSEPADTACTLGTPALNRGLAGSFRQDVAVMKAVGESIERYCGAFAREVVLSPARALDGAIAPDRFELFAPGQYEDPGFSLTRFDEDTVIGWVEGTSLASGQRAYLPGCMVFVPYRAVEGEARICDRISTGLACAHSRAAALAKGILEVVERDALMLTWHNRLAPKRVRLESVADPSARAMLACFEGMALRVDVYCVTVDVPVPVILGVGRSTLGSVPHAVIGLGTSCDPERAIALALEEVALGVWGMRVNAANFGSEDFESLEARGIAYASRGELAANLDFLDRGPLVDCSELPRLEAENPGAELRALVGCLTERSLEPFGCDLTTDDIDEVGFKVCRVVVPAMRPLDIKHSSRHLGGGRLYDAPVQAGLLPRARRLDELNPDPHPFP